MNPWSRFRYSCTSRNFSKISFHAKFKRFLEENFFFLSKENFFRSKFASKMRKNDFGALSKAWGLGNWPMKLPTALGTTNQSSHNHFHAILINFQKEKKFFLTKNFQFSKNFFFFTQNWLQKRRKITLGPF